MAATCVTMLVIVAMTMVAVTSSSRILVIPGTIYSHVNMFTVAAKTLQQDGHEVSILVHDVHAKKIDANINVLTYPLSENATMPIAISRVIQDLTNMDTNVLYKAYYIYNTLSTCLNSFCEELLVNTPLMNNIRDSKFDLAIVDNGVLFRCLHFIPYKFDISRINLGPFQTPWTQGVSSVPFHEPSMTVESRSPQLSFLERLSSFAGALFIEYSSVIMGFDKHAKTFLPEEPQKCISEIMNESEMTLVTTETTCFDFPRVEAPNYRFIGSLSGSVTPQVLKPEYKKFADDAKDGLMIISFGTVTNMQKSIITPIRMLIEAIGQMKEKAVLQFNATILGDVKIPPNLLIRDWLPQTDLLAHHNTKLFITHGGINGHLEATYLGVPLLTLPYTIEQAHNGGRAEAKSHGKLLKWDETNTDELYSTMREIIDDKSYKQNIMKCRDIIKEIPSAKEQLSFWVNHVLKYGSKHLRPISADMSSYQFFGLDVFAVSLTAFLFAVVVFYNCCRCCVKRCNKYSKLKKD